MAELIIARGLNTFLIAGDGSEKPVDLAGMVRDRKIAFVQSNVIGVKDRRPRPELAAGRDAIQLANGKYDYVVISDGSLHGPYGAAGQPPVDSFIVQYYVKVNTSREQSGEPEIRPGGMS